MLFEEYVLLEERIKHKLISLIDDIDKNAFKRWHALGFNDMNDGIKFIVNCNKHKGYIYIKFSSLNNEVIFGKKISNSFKITKHLKNVEDMQLVNVIDKNI